MLKANKHEQIIGGKRKISADELTVEVFIDENRNEHEELFWSHRTIVTLYNQVINNSKDGR